MANFKRKRPRSNCRSNVKHMEHWPKWWDVVFHTRPRRRKEAAIAASVLRGACDADSATWPSGNHAPHHYFW